MHMAPTCLLLCRSSENWHSHRRTSEPGSGAVASGAAYALLHRSNRRMRHPRSQNLVHSKKPKCIHNSRFRIAAWYHSSSTAVHPPHSQLFVKRVALPAPGRSPFNRGAMCTKVLMNEKCTWRLCDEHVNFRGGKTGVPWAGFRG